MISDPAGHVARILRDERELFGIEIDTVDIEDLRVTLVHRDDYFVVVINTIVNDVSAHLLKRREVDKIPAFGIDCHYVKILVAFEVFLVDDAARALPEISGDIALGFVGDANGLSAR